MICTIRFCNFHFFNGYLHMRKCNTMGMILNKRMQIKTVILHYLLEIVIINRSNNTRSLLLDKYYRCHSDRHYKVII